MTSPRPMLLWAAALLSGAATPGQAQQGGPPPTKVSLAPAALRTFQPALRTTAETRPIRESIVAAEIQGSVVEMLVDEGTAVTAGQPLVRFQRTVREIMRRRAEARLELARQQLAEYEAGSREEDVRQAEAEVEEADSLLLEAEKEVRRLEGLRTTEVVSEREYSEARTAAARARALLAQRTANRDRVRQGPRPELIARARAEVEIQAAELALIDVELEKTVIKAPFDGVVVEKRVEAGHRVATGEGLLALVQMDPIHVVAAVPEESIDALTVGAAVQVQLDAMPGEVLVGRIDAIVPRADTRARTFPVKVSLDNPERRVLPGMTARARFALPGGREGAAIPRDALVRSPQGPMVWLVREGKAVPCPVELGQEEGDWLEVTRGLAAGTPVVVRGNELLRPGLDVIVLDDGSGP